MTTQQATPSGSFSGRRCFIKGKILLTCTANPPDMKRNLLLLLIPLLILSACKENVVTTNEPETAPAPYDFNTDSTVYSNEMKRFWLVLLKSGNNRDQDSASAAKIQAAHLANISRLAKEGKIIMAGPIGAEAAIRGIFIMNAKDSAEVAQLVNTDTAVITGRLKMEYYPWWSAKGKFIFK
ncbi:MAG: hypothetical protein DI535_13375 [Citrobacter freundii]|nr:MAG: hypothetical protein DI535_13375 [Citrobacter freundii]